jgi:hypothetical protein
LYFLSFAKNISSSYYQNNWRYFLNHLYSVFVTFLYVFGFPVSFSSFFLDYFVRIYPKPVETTTNSTNAKLVNFTRKTIENCFVPSVYSFLLSGKFCILKALVFFIFLAKKKWWSGKNRERLKEQGSGHRSQCIIASQCTHISQLNRLLYPTYIIITNTTFFQWLLLKFSIK